MLELDSARWSELAQAHGSAEDVPRLLEALQTLEGLPVRVELWFGVWATLCPDGHLYDAAYAAVPHLLAITNGRGPAERVAAVHVAAEVEILRHEPGAPGIPHDLIPSYALAIESLPSLVAALASEPWDSATAQVLAAAMLAGKHQPALGRVILSHGLSE